MQVLIVDDMTERQENLTIALLRGGFQVTATSNIKLAETCIQCGHVDMMVSVESIGGKRTHGLALLAEYQNPMVSTLLITERTDEDVDELFELMPSLHGLIGTEVSYETIEQLLRGSIDTVISVPDSEDHALPLLLETRATGAMNFAAPPRAISEISQVA